MGWYHQNPIYCNNSRANLKSLARKVNSKDMLMLEKIHRMLCHYWEYIEAYHLLDHGIGLNGEGNHENSGNIGIDKRRWQNDEI